MATSRCCRSVLAATVSAALFSAGLSVLATTPTLAQGTTADEVPVAASRAFVVPVTGVAGRLITDLGPHSSRLRGQMLFEQRRDASSAVALVLRDVNLLGQSVPTSRGPTGPHSLRFGPGAPVPVVVDPATGRLVSSMVLLGHYALIDWLVGTKQISRDQWAPFSESFGGELRARLNMSGLLPDAPATFTGHVRLKLAAPVAGAIRELEFTVPPTPIAWLPPACDARGAAFRVLPIQPVFVRHGPDDVWPTGGSFDTLLEHAQAVWNKACVTLVARRPLWIDDGALKVLDGNDEDVALRDGEQGAADTVEVYVVASAPIFGGPATMGSGAGSAHVIIGDDTLTADPPSLNALAHEIGHVLGLCHPGVGELWCNTGNIVLVEGSPGTVMEPSGADADNPDLQSLDNCLNVASPLLVYRRLYCCLRPDCESDCTAELQ